MPKNMEDGDERHGDAEIDMPVHQAYVARWPVAVIDEESHQEPYQARSEAGDAQGDIPDFPVRRFGHLAGFHHNEGEEV